MNNFMQLDEKAAEQAGSGGGISDGGAFTGFLSSRMVTAKTGTKGVEFSLHLNRSPNGQYEHSKGDANYLTLYYELGGGAQNPIGFNLIQAIMFCCGVSSTTVEQHPIAREDGNGFDYYIPEFEGKQVGFVLQKTLDLKDNGEEFYKFDIVLPFKAGTGQTVQEINARAQPEQVQKRVENLKVIDKRQSKQSAQRQPYDRAQSNATAARPTSKFDQVPKDNQAGQFHDDDFPY